MKNLLFIVSIGVFLVSMSSCSKKEGVGGSSTLKGVVVVQDIALDGRFLNEKYNAVDKDVYIQYGSSNDGDDVKTNTAGVYSFPYLVEGDYKIYCYSDDSLGGSQKVSKIRLVTVKGSSTTLDTITIYKILDYDDGDNTLVGTVLENQFYNGTQVFSKVLTAQDKDIYIRDITNNTQKDGVVDRVRTTPEGKYIFLKLIPGKYELYVYSESFVSKRDSVVRCTVNVTGHKQIVEAPLMYIHNY